MPGLGDGDEVRELLELHVFTAYGHGLRSPGTGPEDVRFLARRRPRTRREPYGAEGIAPGYRNQNRHDLDA
ncbi:hypothetical protein GCM10009530_31090 [Microbispora corallina]|uniref:Uncharacterized protein n=1 Tax=Microbispora corallina TaxID=83302 RepID=A0ABQ4G0H1_9ACTN|nr:hypothetical protein Mco01_35610 [Microbispora corallina]